jgi:hypothetical protein
MRAMNQEEIVEIFEQPMTISNEHDVHLQRSRCSSLTVMVMGRSWAFPLSITTTCFEESEEEFLLVRCRQPTTKRDKQNAILFNAKKSKIRRERPFR